MAQAGFVYTPQHSGDDLATCLYCNTSLSGWDAEDDPMYVSFSFISSLLIVFIGRNIVPVQRNWM